MKQKNKKDSSDKKVEKRRYRFNLIDILLILFAVAIVFVAINVVSPFSFMEKLKSNSDHTIQYTVEFTCVDQEYIDRIKEDDAVMDAISKNALGTVTAVDYNTHYSELKYDEENQVGKLADYTDKYNLIVTITAEGIYTSGKGYSVNSQRIAVGEKMSLRFPDYAAECYCIDISIDR